MATINYDVETNFGAATALAVGKVQEAIATLQRTKDAAFAAYSVATDWAALEGGDFGAPVAGGQAYYDAISGLLAELTTSNATIFKNRLDKGA